MLLLSAFVYTLNSTLNGIRIKYLTKNTFAELLNSVPLSAVYLFYKIALKFSFKKRGHLCFQNYE